MRTFGEYVKNKRLENKITLRQFCIRTGLDPSNWSKIERNKMQPPKSKEVVERIANVLHLEKNSEEWNTLIDLAVISSIPKELVQDKSILNKLPLVFRTLRGDSPSREELEDLIQVIKES